MIKPNMLISPKVLILVLALIPWGIAHSQVETTAVWLFNEHEGLYPSSVLHDLSDNEYVMVLGRGGRIVPGRSGNALEIIDPEPMSIPDAEFPARFGITPIPKPPGRTVEPMLWSNAYFAALMTSGENELRKEVGFVQPTRTRLNLGDFDWTVEFWYRPTRTRSEDGTVFEIGSGPRAENEIVTRLSLNPDGSAFTLGNAASGARVEIPSSREHLRGGWAHYAFVYDAAGNRLRHFVNGALHGTPIRIDMKALPEGEEDYFTVGRDGRWGRPLYGIIDELRFSSGQRYTSAFTPPEGLKSVYLETFEQKALRRGPPLLFGAEGPPVPVPLGDRKHLFVDDALLDTTKNVTFTMNPPRVGEQVLELRGQRDGRRHDVFRKHVTVIEDEDGRIRMYTGVEDDYLGIWISEDGVNFVEPDTGIHHRGRHNIVIPEPVAVGTVFIDPNAPPNARWKYISDFHRRGLYLYTSPDGLSFTRFRQAVLPFRSGSQNDVFYDDQRGVYVAFHRSDIARTPAGSTRREFVRTEKKDITELWPFQPVTEARLEEVTRFKTLHRISPSPWYIDNGPLTPGGFGIEYETAFEPDPKIDPVTAGVYNPKAIKYPYAPDTYLAFPVMYFHYYEGGAGRMAHVETRGGGPTETQFAASRDGINWTRYPRPAYSGIGRYGKLDIVQTFIAQGVVKRGDEIWQYVFLDSDYHTAAQPRTRERSVYRLIQRFDGFVSIDTPYEKYGKVVTKPLRFKGNRLVLNINTDAHGYARVALLDPHGRPLDGFSYEESVIVNGNFIDAEMEWLHAGKDVSSLEGRTIRVGIQMRGTKLYSMQFKNK